MARPIGLRPATGRRALTFSERMLPSAAVAGCRGVFVGRADELAGLEAAAAAARRGQPQVVLVEGEAGIGKSTLLARFASGLAGTPVLRASGDEAELLLPYGIVGQLVASARGAGDGPPGLLAAELSDRVDPLAVGAELVGWLGQFPAMVLAVIDDLQWADGPSARALLFAVRRLHADQVLVVMSARAGELPRLGEGWQRFLAGDHRAGRVRLGGLGPEEVVTLGRALGAGELPRRAADRLLEETGGNPLYCRAVLEELGTEGLDRPGGALGVPRSLAGVVLLRVGALSPAARDLVAAAAVLGHHCELAAVAALAGLGDPLPALGEAVAAGMLIEQPGAAAGIGFGHLLVQRAVYGDLSPAERRRLHQRAAGLVDRERALGHRVAAAVGPDDGLADELEAASQQARRLGRTAQAAAWLAQAAAASSRSRRIAACWTRWRSWSPTGRWPRRRSLPPGWRPPGRARGAAGCWAPWICSRAGPPRPRPACWRRGKATTRPGTRPWAPQPLPPWRRSAWSRAGSRRRSNGVSGRRRPAPPRPPCATAPWACWRTPFSPLGGDWGAPSFPDQDPLGSYRKGRGTGDGEKQEIYARIPRRSLPAGH